MPSTDVEVQDTEAEAQPTDEPSLADVGLVWYNDPLNPQAENFNPPDPVDPVAENARLVRAIQGLPPEGEGEGEGEDVG